MLINYCSYCIITANLDYIPITVNLTLSPDVSTSGSCSHISILSDELALEGDEVFRVSVQLFGGDERGRVLLEGGDYALVVDSVGGSADVIISDVNGK